MKIVSVKAQTHSMPYKGVALRFGVGNMVKRDLVLVTITADDGTVGYGEAHHGLAPTAVAEVINHSLAPLVTGADAMDREWIYDRIYRAQYATHGTGAAVAMGASGIDIALWDLAGKLLGQPVTKLLGGSPRKVRAYAGGLALGFQPLDTLEAEVGRLADAGYTAIKLRVGQEVGIDAERVRHIRRTFGDGLDIAVDAQTRYDMLDIGAIARYCEENRVYWLEEPFTTDNIDGYLAIKRRTATPLAAGENHFTRQTFRDLLRAGALDILQADCTKAGGISEVKKIGDMAAAWHLHLAPHTSQSVLSTAANLAVLGASPNGLIFEADLAEVNPYRDRLATNAPTVGGGNIEVPDGPGLGVDIDTSVLADYPPIPGPSYAATFVTG
jgi:L-alanine-DL-glutamate epimerase-like enolase superfamily enzyme